jgi:hypothetical protein
VRTTLTIDDDLMEKLRDVAHRRGLPIRKLVDMTLRVGLRGLAAKRRPSRPCPAFAMGTPAVDLDRAGALAAALEDEEIARKLELRK